MLLHRQVGAEDLRHVAGLDLRLRREGRHAHVHAHPAHDGAGVSVQPDAAPVGQRPVQAVGISDGQHRRASAVRAEAGGAAVAHRGVRREGAHRRHPAVQRHHRLEPRAVQPLAGGVGVVAVQGDAGAHHVHMGTGIV